MSLGLSANFLAIKFIKWNIEPEIGIRHDILNVREVPFPAVTVCPQTKVKMEFLSFRETYKNYWQQFRLYGVSDIDADRFQSLLQICDPELTVNLQLNESDISSGHNVVRLLKEMSYSIDDSMVFCKYRSVLMDCSSLFTEVITSEGICFSFNMMNHKEIFKDIIAKDFDSYHHDKNASWTLDDGYDNDDLKAYPYPVVSQRYDALRIILKTTDVDLDYICQGSSQGFKVFLHPPSELPAVTGNHLFLPIKHDTTVALTAKVTKVSEKLAAYKPSQRKCYLANEKPLKFFKFYTRTACHLEFLANYTMKACGCVKFSAPRENSSRICDFSQVHCLMRAKRTMMLLYNHGKIGEDEFGCLPSCTEISYNMETFQTDFDYKKLFASYTYDLSDMPG